VVSSNAEDRKFLMERELPSFQADERGVHYCVESIHTILDHFGAPQAPRDIFSMHGDGGDNFRFIIQALKKLYGLRYLAKPYMLWADAELLVLKPLTFKELFGGYFSHPYVFYSRAVGDNGRRVVSLGPDFINTIEPSFNLLLGAYHPWGDGWQHYPNFMGYQGWFTEASVIEGLFAHAEALAGSSLLERIRGSKDWQFEPQIIYGYLWLHQRRYPQYHFVSFEDAIPTYLGNGSAAYLGKHASAPTMGWGMECMTNDVPMASHAGFVRFLRDFDVRFFRTDCRHLDAQLKRLFRDSPLAIQVCSVGADWWLDTLTPTD
jgi:hypothetical protein